MADTSVQIIYGELKLKPLHYWVRRTKLETLNWFGFKTVKREYWVCCEFSCLGSWSSYEKAYDHMLFMRAHRV